VVLVLLSYGAALFARRRTSMSELDELMLAV